MPDRRTLNDKARLLRSLHDVQDGEALVLPNAWDAAGAALIAGAGARAVATTSGGIAWSLGRPDGQHLTRQEMAEALRRIVAAVDVPVTADVEGGYGPAPGDVRTTVEAVIEAGAAGINLEDSRAPGGPLFDPGAQARRITAARRAAAAGAVPDLVVNARTDVFLAEIGAPEGRLDEVLRRGLAYAGAGADCLFVPGLLDAASLKALAHELPMPVNAMAVPGGPDIAELAAAGVRRISVGATLAQVAHGALRRAAAGILAGTFEDCAGALEFAEVDSLFDRSGR
ncbi:isocitrate lyase/phosphoenolpyruvate mutase family protein [Streptomyces sp. WMMB 322]|uniref:isocitrate lyase/PEP mutase family protein n=1 Tax=Streptomyces sp. WMMB 322 TaxID=1286821 RepID=UPI0006E2A7BE|nr:isocitrate lyase/phosphoenolpyruvate mutase family protein [Streptomyces sp. WMMB 322]SCK55808.1 2-Methylisocitrate lyase, PEP mutase family [Streptomyces sp. WMMB 322]